MTQRGGFTYQQQQQLKCQKIFLWTVVLLIKDTHAPHAGNATTEKKIASLLEAKYRLCSRGLNADLQTCRPTGQPYSYI